MIKSDLFIELSQSLKNKIYFAEDKPEESLETTMKALWFIASGHPKSVSAAIELPLPDLTNEQLVLLKHLIEKRLQNIPLAYITGRQRFMGIDFICDNRALIPRKETEILGRKALELSFILSEGKQSINVFDICCGGGNLGLSIALLNSKSIVYSTDISHEAIELTNENILMLNVKQKVKAWQGDLFSAVDDEKFIENTDLIICNPPYISSGKVKNMNPEILGKEPAIAFDGGMFGTKIIQRLIVEAHKFLKKNGWLIFEVGAGQGEFIVQMCKRTTLYSDIETSPDENGIIRVISVKK